MRNVRDIVSSLLKDDSIKEKKPYIAPVEPVKVVEAVVVVEAPKRTPKREAPERTEGLMSRIESMNRGPVNRESFQFLDHTHSVNGVIEACLLVRYNGAALGYVWTDQAVWHWETIDAKNFGNRATRKKAAEALHDVHTMRNFKEKE